MVLFNAESAALPSCCVSQRRSVKAGLVFVETLTLACLGKNNAHVTTDSILFMCVSIVHLAKEFIFNVLVCICIGML